MIINRGKTNDEILKRYLVRTREKGKQPEPEKKKDELKIFDKKGFIYVPDSRVHIAKERSLCGKNWYETHKELQEQGLRMPTIKEFTDFILYLQNNPRVEDGNKILDDILKIGKWRSEWLDAKFVEENGRLMICYNHYIDKDGNLQVRSRESLEEYVKESCYVNLEFNRQGLPTKESGKRSYKQGENIYYFYALTVERVAWFSVDSVRAYLDCDRDPDGHGASLGVFGCAEGTQNL